MTATTIEEPAGTTWWPPAPRRPAAREWGS